MSAPVARSKRRTCAWAGFRLLTPFVPYGPDGDGTLSGDRWNSASRWWTGDNAAGPHVKLDDGTGKKLTPHKVRDGILRASWIDLINGEVGRARLIMRDSAGSATATLRPGESAWTYSAPDGFQALLPCPAGACGEDTVGDGMGQQCDVCP